MSWTPLAASLAGALLALAASVPGSAQTAPAPSPAYADEWLVTSGTGAKINLHETSRGPAGRLVSRPGVAHPVRNIVRRADRLSFVIPTLNATYSAAREGAGWSGEWSDDNGKRTVALTPTTAPARQERWVTLPDGRQMFIACVGAGAPAVIFEAGGGGDSTSWRGLPAEVGKVTQACTYDRAGMGVSDPGPLPRHTAAVTDDLEALLTAAGVRGPYVLVGHSLGGYSARHFANTRFGKTAGLVLVDSSGDGQDARFTAAVPNYARFNENQSRTFLDCIAAMRARFVRTDDPMIAGRCHYNDAAKVETFQSEFAAMEGPSTQQLTRSRRSWGDLPLIVLTAGRDDEVLPPEFAAGDSKTMLKVIVDMHKEMAALSTAGQHRVVEGAGHYIHWDKPEAVTGAILEVVAAARGRGAR